MRSTTLILAVLSLVLCIAAIVGWAWSYLEGTVVIGSVRGSLALACLDAGHDFLRSVSGDDNANRIVQMLDTFGFDANHRFAGFAYVAGNVNGAGFWMVEVPYWLIVLVTAILPVRVFVQRRQRRSRERSGHCLACGYDLRGSPRRCPECGATAGGDARRAPAEQKTLTPT